MSVLGDQLWEALKAAGCGPRLVRVNIHPEALMRLRKMRDDDANWFQPPHAKGEPFRFCGYDLHPDRTVAAGEFRLQRIEDEE